VFTHIQQEILTIINSVMFCPPVIVNPSGEPYLYLGFLKSFLLQTIILYVYLNVLLMFLSGSWSKSFVIWSIYALLF